MKSVCLVLLVAVFCISFNKAEDLQIGNGVGSTLIYLENVKLSAIPLKQRTKTVFFSSDKNQIIKAISAIDQKRSRAKATVTAGGVGSTFVNIKFKSERGEGLDYQVQIYA
ncbi:transcription activator MBF2 domain-containing protein [Phthorimaea operculella]|nr:transcription activator MBF2 domain-containing protein [Phthorimaea operculella]